MRYVIRLIVPVLVFAGAVYLLTRRPRHDGTKVSEDRNQAPQRDSDTGPFIAILIVSAVVALGAAYLLESLWEQH